MFIVTDDIGFLYPGDNLQISSKKIELLEVKMSIKNPVESVKLHF